MRSPGSGHLRAGTHRRDRRDMTAFPTAAHLVSWAKFAPSTSSPPAGRNAAPPAKATPGWPAPSARSSPALARTNTFLGERYRRLARRRGKRRAIVAVGNSVLTIIWHLLSDPDARYHDLGPDYYETEDQPPAPPTRPHPPTRTPHRPESHPHRRRLTTDHPPTHPEPPDPRPSWHARRQLDFRVSSGSHGSGPVSPARGRRVS